jgi:hypothetical protein
MFLAPMETFLGPQELGRSRLRKEWGLDHHTEINEVVIFSW